MDKIPPYRLAITTLFFQFHDNDGRRWTPTPVPLIDQPMVYPAQNPTPNNAIPNYNHRNLAGLLAIIFLRTSICLAWALLRNSATPLLSFLRTPLE